MFRFNLYNLFKVKIVLRINSIVKKYMIENFNFFYLASKEKESQLINSFVSQKSKIYPKYIIRNSSIDDYTYVSENSVINNTKIGKFCSLGPNLICGWGIHPINKLSTSPMFYSVLKQNGYSLTMKNKFLEFKNIEIGNDVFIGMNVTILDGFKIGDGAIIGAGAVVSKDIPSYAVAVGNPIKILKYRFDNEKIESLLRIKWWNWDDEKLKIVERHLEDIDQFINEYNTSNSYNEI